MSAHCCEHETPKPAQIANLTRYRRVLWGSPQKTENKAR
jgi:hypothetical protein